MKATAINSIIRITLAVALLAPFLQAQTERWCALNTHSVEVFPDGNVHLWANREGLPLQTGLNPKGVVVLGERVLLVDADVVWSVFHSHIVGRRNGQPFTKLALGRDIERGTPRDAAKDQYGRTWFANRSHLYCFDGKKWKVRKLGLERLARNTNPTHLSSSRDRSRVYVWHKGSYGFLVLTGEDLAIERVDLEHGSSPSPLYELHPLGADQVLVTPGLNLLGPEQWNVPKPIEQTTAPQQPRTSAIGQFELAHSSLISSDDGQAWIRAQSAWEWARSAPPTEGRALPIPKATRERSQETGSPTPLVTGESSYLFSVNSFGDIKRATPTWEAFVPTYVDRFGVGWRLRERAELKRLEGDQVWTLVDIDTRAPVAVSRLAGIDAHGRAFFQLTTKSWFAHDPSVEPSTLDRFAWELSTEPIWSAQNESKARERVSSLVQVRDLDSAARIINYYSRLAHRAPSSLEDPTYWVDLSSALRGPINRSREWTSLQLAQLASVIGLKELTQTALAEILSDEKLSEQRNPSKSAQSSGKIAYQNGWFESSVAAYGKALRWPIQRDHDHRVLLTEAVRAAVHARDYAQAIQWIDERERISRTWQITLAQNQRRMVQALLVNPEDWELNLRFVQDFWLKNQTGHKPRHADAVIALESLLKRFKPTLDQRRTLFVQLQIATAGAGDLDRASLWSERILREFHDEPYTIARSRMQLARSYSKASEFEPAIDLYRQVATNKRKTPETARAQFELGIQLGKDGRLEEAIQAFKARILASEQPSPFKTDDTYAFSSAQYVSRYYEELGEYAPAIQYARIMLEKYSTRGAHCTSGEESWLQQHRQRIARLEELLK